MTQPQDPLDPEVLSPEGFVLQRRPPKRVVRTTVAGANRGAQAALDALAAINTTSRAITLVPHYVDPIDGRAEALAETARTRGLDGAEATASRIQDQGELVRRSDLVIHHLDRADALAASHALTIESRTPSLSYLAISLPARGVIGVATADDLTNPVTTRQIQAHYRGVARVSARAGSGAVFGVDAPTANTHAESLIRAWFAKHTDDCAQKIAAGVALTRCPIEITFDGDESIPLFVVQSETAATSLEALAESVLGNPHTPIPRGSRFVICEVLPTSLRYVTVRHRSLGGINITADTTVRESDIVARAAVQRAGDDGGVALSLLSLVVGVAVLANASRTNPLHTTD